MENLTRKLGVLAMKKGSGQLNWSWSFNGLFEPAHEMNIEVGYYWILVQQTVRWISQFMSVIMLNDDCNVQ